MAEKQNFNVEKESNPPIPQLKPTFAEDSEGNCYFTVRYPTSNQSEWIDEFNRRKHDPNFDQRAFLRKHGFA
jgi:hypothetical protein